jgi:CRP-like cAMP-binding protein
METTGVLKQAFLFESLTDGQMDDIIRLGKEMDYSAGDVIFTHGKRAETVHILLNGRISVRIKDDEETDLMAKILEEPGAVFGTVALVKPHVYNVTAEAVSDAKTFSMEASRLTDAMKADPVLGFEIMCCLSQSYLHRLNIKRMGMISLYKAFRSQNRKSEIYDAYREVA